MKYSLLLGVMVVIALSLVGFGESLTGSWSVEFHLDQQTASFTDSLSIWTELRVNYSIGDWTFGAITELDDTGWIDQEFSAIGTLGLLNASAALGFDPPTVAFEKWTTTLSGEFVGLSFSATFELYDEDAFLTLTGSGSTDAVDVNVTARFGDDDDPIGECDLDFTQVTIGIDFTFCCADVESTIYFDCDGFDRVVFAADDIAIPNLLWMTLDVELEFTVQTKTLTFSPDFDFGNACLDVYVGVETSGNLIIEDLYFDGIKVECDIAGVEFTGISFWGTHVSKPGALGEYWEMYQIESGEEGCCGPLSFEGAVFFDEASNNLFDVALFSFEASVAVTDNLTFGLDLEIDVATGVDLWVFSLDVEW
jgi:hypothetical protein